MTDFVEEIAETISAGEYAAETFEETAQAIIGLIIARIPPLVWHKSTIAGWNGDYHTVPTGYTVRCADEWGWKWSYNGGFGYEDTPEAAKAAANAHHVAQLCKGMGIE